ncbi:hypothetical protein EJ08DRAFT_655312 [Tothia fuscella]|uniref:Uncharacterized protein n=1 Tax=Tothia fuscella TaxID=1048955 RepID=A0A9P4U4N0_9PEZI|nr:hypothetical protein EJ08DRAFT_655312 [Tothia fuscella]
MAYRSSMPTPPPPPPPQMALPQSLKIIIGHETQKWTIDNPYPTNNLVNYSPTVRAQGQKHDAEFPNGPDIDTIEFTTNPDSAPVREGLSTVLMWLQTLPEIGYAPAYNGNPQIHADWVKQRLKGDAPLPLEFVLHIQEAIILLGLTQESTRTHYVPTQHWLHIWIMNYIRDNPLTYSELTKIWYIFSFEGTRDDKILNHALHTSAFILFKKQVAREVLGELYLACEDVPEMGRRIMEIRQGIKPYRGGKEKGKGGEKGQPGQGGGGSKGKGKGKRPDRGEGGSSAEGGDLGYA